MTLRFLDTNILLYSISRDPTETVKRDRAVALIDAGGNALSVQAGYEEGICRVVSVLSRSQFGSALKNPSSVRVRDNDATPACIVPCGPFVTLGRGLSFSSSSSLLAMTRVTRRLRKGNRKKAVSPSAEKSTATLITRAARTDPEDPIVAPSRAVSFC